MRQIRDTRGLLCVWIVSVVDIVGIDLLKDPQIGVRQLDFPGSFRIRFRAGF